MAPLERLIRADIAEAGPITLARYMALCLGHPEHGYYRRKDPLGAAGDFTTAPEVSQIFGELIGLWLAQCWRDQGAPSPVALVELGPGRGTLIADALRGIGRAAPAFLQAAQICLVETSPALREKQAEALAGAAPVWLDTFDDAPDLPVFLVANEFFDALPIHRFVKSANGWREQVVTLGDDTAALQFGWSAPHPLAEIAGPDVTERAEKLGLSAIETCPLGVEITAQIAARLARTGGAALLIDYGYDRAALVERGGADTFQAVRRHQPVDPLQNPGDADLTAHVDFDALAAAGKDAVVWGPIPQGSLLRALGAEARTAALARATPDQAEAIAAGLHRLTHPAEMGRLFKAMALTPHDAPTAPAGFEGARHG